VPLLTIWLKMWIGIIANARLVDFNEITLEFSDRKEMKNQNEGWL
jgi:hypothetical protein